MLVDSQMFVTGSQLTHADLGHDQLCCLSETLEKGQISLKGSADWAASSTQGGGNHRCLPQRVGRTLAAPRYIGQVGPTVKDFSNQSSGAVGSIFNPETFQAGTIRETHSRNDGQYHGGIFNTCLWLTRRPLLWANK